MAAEAQTIIGAGLWSVAWALSVGSFRIISIPKFYERLTTSLSTRSSAPSIVPDLQEVGKLPDLRGCITEAIRQSNGVSARHSRVLNRPFQYNRWTIPPHTVVGMTNVEVHHNESIFSDSHAYIPEQWLGSQKAPQGSSLERYFV